MFNRRRFHPADLKFKNAIRYKHPLSILIFDIDLFKKVNDTFRAPDRRPALIHVAEIFHRQARGSGVLARYGGEEFIALLPGNNQRGMHSTPLNDCARCPKIPYYRSGGHSIFIDDLHGIAGMKLLMK
ncbi:MAG: GGDEF domain-containing protein [Anaerolineales bacterium]|nr:GGDEF domain-containing protein [Anaerolineales bacterium]